MSEPFAALIFRPDEVPLRALSLGAAVAVAGYDVPDPHLLIAPLRELRGWSVAFYRSGAARKGGLSALDEFDHARDLFEEELPPGLLVQRAAADPELDGAEHAAGSAPPVLALALAEDLFHDDAWRFDGSGVERRFVRDGDDGLEAGSESPDRGEVVPLELDVDDDVGEAEEREAIARAIAPHRGSKFLAAELGAPVIGPLVGALFVADERVPVRLVEPDAASISSEARRLNRCLRRVDGRGAFEPPDVAGVPAPATYRALVATYDWADPSDPPDLYRELAIGGVEGTLRLFRAADLDALAAGPAWRSHADARLYPVGALGPSALGGERRIDRILALDGGGARLVLVEADGRVAEAGPSLGELLRYLALGWIQRTASQELVIGALMLRARVRRGS